MHCLSPFASFLADNYPWPQRCPSENSTVKEGKTSLLDVGNLKLKLLLGERRALDEELLGSSSLKPVF